MKYYTAFLAIFIASSLSYADMLNTGSNDYYMTPPSPSSSVSSGSAPVQEQCWYEQVPINGTAQGDNTPNVGGAIVGGIIGGIVGHQIGSGDGNTAATVAGAALGTALGASVDNAPSAPQYQMIKKCNTSH